MTVPRTAGLRILDISLRSRPGATATQAFSLASAGLTSILLPPMHQGALQTNKLLAAAVAACGAVPAAAVTIGGITGINCLASFDDLRSAGVEEALVRSLDSTS